MVRQVFCAAAVLVTLACHEDVGVGDVPVEPIEVESLRLTGVEAIDESELRDVLATRVTPWLPWSEPRYFDRDAFEQDLARITAYYANHGYPDAEVTAYDIDLSDAGTSVSLHVVVDEGAPLRVSSINLTGFEVLHDAQRENVRERLSIATGEPLVQQQLVESAERAAHVLKNSGYPWAEVAISRELTNDGVAVRLSGRPGMQATFGEIEVIGNSSVDDEIIKRQLVFRPGEPYALDAVRDSLRQLYSLELFEFANIEFAGETRGGDTYPTRVVVTESDHRRLELSVGYGTEEKGRVEARWRHVNFYGGARTLTLHGKWSWLDRGVEATLLQPYFVLPRVSISTQGQSWYVDEPAFNAFSRGGRSTVTYTAGPQASVRAHLGYEYQRSQIRREALGDLDFRDELIALGLNPETGIQDGVLATLGMGAQLSRVDDALNPTSGYFVAGDVEQAGGWLPGSYHYLKALGEVRAYASPHDRVTLATRVRYGAIDPFGPPSNIPFFKRFFLGGATSLRGWGRYEVAPLSDSGLPVGGSTLFESSAEVRARVWGDVGVVGFVDVGNVWPAAWSARPDDLLYDAGPGLRYHTPIGPVRLDLAYQLNRLEGLRLDGELRRRRWRVHFSIGQAF